MCSLRQVLHSPLSCKTWGLQAVQLEVRLTCVSTLACSMSVRASAVRPLMATPMCVSTSAIFSMLDGS